MSLRGGKPLNHIRLCKVAKMSLRAERRNRKVGEIQRQCDYDVAVAPRNDEKYVGWH